MADRPASEHTIKVVAQPSREDAAAVFDFLRRHNEEHLGEIRRVPLTVIARDAEGTVVGGVHGETLWGWLYVAIVAVAENWRRHGLGTRLLREAESEAVRRGCTNVWLDTFSFQAQPFYEREGYHIFGALEDFPPGETRYFMTKALTPR
jgi:GNAT superfamily N-acetyltransferase